MDVLELLRFFIFWFNSFDFFLFNDFLNKNVRGIYEC